jgi:2-(1,2-epoxy-1,2-dihydrophenyl)acetyl-CoA isomerase
VDPVQETTPEPVVVTDSSRVRTIRINRPDALNALDLTTKIALRDAVLAAAGDPQVRCVVLTGTGSRAFCVGQDLRELVALQQAADTSLDDTVTEHFNPMALALATMPKPVIAAVNGVAAGAGAALTFPADLRLVAASAGFNTAFTGVALSADTGASWWLPRLIGHGPAMDLLLRPRTVGADEALVLGLASSCSSGTSSSRPGWRRSRPPSPQDRRWRTAPSAGPWPTRAATTWSSRWPPRPG